MINRLKRATQLLFWFWFLQWALFLIFRIIAGVATAEAPEPQPEFGRVFQITVCGKGGCHTGFVKPWIAHVWNTLWPIEATSFGIVLAALLTIAVIAKGQAVRKSN